MTDRELLEMAAKAAGMTNPRYVADGRQLGWAINEGISVESGPTSQRLWNPLHDDGDALRLAVKLDMCLGIAPHAVALDKTSLALAPGGDEVSIKHNGDPYAATRRAIVRAAAAIGKDMT